MGKDSNRHLSKDVQIANKQQTYKHTNKGCSMSLIIRGRQTKTIMVMDVNQTYCGDHFTIYANSKSCCIPESN